MSHPNRQSVSRRSFLTAMAATSAALGVSALAARDADAATQAQNPNPPATAPRPSDQLPAGITRTEVQRSVASIPGREIVQVLTTIPPGVESGWHIHPGEEVGYIIAGTLEMKVEGQPTRTLHAGDGFLIPPRTPHSAFDVGPEIGLMLSTYIVEPGEPLVTLTG